MSSDALVQRSLFGAGDPAFDATFSQLRRVRLDATSWIDLAPAWVVGSDTLFEHLLRTREWAQRDRFMYDHKVAEPRLTSRWTLASGRALEPPVLEHMRRALSDRYGVVFDSAGFNLYRDGRDSVAWHRDRIRKEVPDPVVPLVSLGAARKLMFRPYGSGASRSFPIGRGDLLVTGGSTQRTWEHAVLKVSHAEPRISIAFRYGVDPRAYGREHGTKG